ISSENYTQWVTVVPSRGGHAIQLDPSLALRRVTCAAEATEYTTARKRADDLRKNLELRFRAHLAYAFPDEPWGTTDLVESLASGSRQGPDFLLSATGNADVARRWADQHGPFSIFVYAFDLASALPADEAVGLFTDVIPKLLVKPRYGALLKTPPRMVAQALAWIDTDAAAASLAPYANDPVLGPT